MTRTHIIGVRRSGDRPGANIAFAGKGISAIAWLLGPTGSVFGEEGALVCLASNVGNSRGPSPDVGSKLGIIDQVNASGVSTSNRPIIFIFYGYFASLKIEKEKGKR